MMKVLLLSVLLFSAIIAERGIDINADVCGTISTAELECFIAQGYTFLIIQAWSGGFGINNNLAGCVSRAKTAGFTYIDVYAYICPVCSGNNPPTNMAASLSAAIAPLGINYVWLDVEGCPPSNCWPSASSGVTFLQQTIAAFESHGTKIGIYSSEGSWSVTGSSTAFGNKYPLWYAHFDNSASFSDASAGFGSFGGWSTTPTMKQYTGDATVCNVDVDLDYWPARPNGNTPTPPPPTPSGCTTIYATSADVNLRDAASLSGNVLATMPTGSTVYEIGTTVTVSGGYNWVHVSYNGQLGYAADEFLTKSGTCTPPPADTFHCVTASPNLNLRSSPSTSASVLASMPTGVYVTDESCCTSANGYSWRQVKFNHIVGYAADEFLKVCTPSGLYQNSLNVTDIGIDTGYCNTTIAGSANYLVSGLPFVFALFGLLF